MVNGVGDFDATSRIPGFNPLFGGGMNAFGGNGFLSNSLSSNGFSSNGPVSNGLTSNGYSSNGFSSTPGFGVGNSFGPLIGDPLYGGLGGPNFMAGSALVTDSAAAAAISVSGASASPPPIGAEVSRSKFLPQIVAANRERGENLSKDEREAKNILDSFKNMNF